MQEKLELIKVELDLLKEAEQNEEKMKDEKRWWESLAPPCLGSLKSLWKQGEVTTSESGWSFCYM